MDQSDKPVKLVVARPSTNNTMEFSIVRKEVQIPSITYNLASFDQTIGVIQFTLVAESSPDEMTAAIEALTQQGAKRFILDIRNNGGGLVEAGADVARLFLPEGIFLQQQFKSKEPILFNADAPGKFSSLPIVIVANQNTASAAEIIAGSLQRFRNVRLVGNKTYGKDSVQLVYDLSDGSSLHVTAGKWWFPGDENDISLGGLKLDLVLTDEEANSAVALEKAAQLLQSIRNYQKSFFYILCGFTALNIKLVFRVDNLRECPGRLKLPECRPPGNRFLGRDQREIRVKTRLAPSCMISSQYTRAANHGCPRRIW